MRAEERFLVLVTFDDQLGKCGSDDGPRPGFSCSGGGSNCADWTDGGRTVIWGGSRDEVLLLLFLRLFLFIFKGYFLKKDFIYFQRNGEGGRKRGREMSIGCLSHAPNWGDLARNPGMCPDQESNQGPSGLQARTQCTEPRQTRALWLFLRWEAHSGYFYPSTMVLKARGALFPQRTRQCLETFSLGGGGCAGDSGCYWCLVGTVRDVTKHPIITTENYLAQNDKLCCKGRRWEKAEKETHPWERGATLFSERAG